MVIETKVRKIGNSLGIVLPKEAIQALQLEEGTPLYLTEAPDSTMRITVNDPAFDKAMGVVERGMKKYRNALRELAK